MATVFDIPANLGARPTTGERGERVRRSPQYRDGAFHNAEGVHRNPDGGTLAGEWRSRGKTKPGGPIPVVVPEFPNETSGLHITWFGHASALIEIDGRRVLVDPVWSDRCSPVPFLGPRRIHEPPVPLAKLPRVDAIIISHDHYDHLDLDTVRRLTRSSRAPFLVPLGVGAHLERWKVPAERIIELDWHESAEVAGLQIIATPAHHFSGRTFKRNDTLWTSWVVKGGGHSVYYTGDTGYFPGFRDIGVEHGPFDATLVQCGAYSPAWPDIHMTPEEAVATHLDVRGGLLVPVHWATFTLAFHGWGEPVDRLWREAKARDVSLAVPRPGERVDVADPPPVTDWWNTLAPR